MTPDPTLRPRGPFAATPAAWPASLTMDASFAIRAGSGEIHVWPIAVRHSAAKTGRERRMRVQAAREDAWSGVRRVLASYASGDPDGLEFERDAAGKPRLVGHHGIDFSLSHAEGLAVVAVSCSGSIGIDVEALRSFENAGALARRFLSPAEHEAVARADGDDRDRVFLQAWTRKEAVLKAVGVGLAWDTRLPHVGTGPGTTRVDAGLPGGATACVRSALLSTGWLLAVAWMSRDEEPAVRAFDASILPGVENEAPNVGAGGRLRAPPENVEPAA